MLSWLYVFLANDNYKNTYYTSNNCDKIMMITFDNIETG